MNQYHKIQTVFKRDPENKYKTLLEGEYSRPEFEYLQDNDWEFTEKVDGTNIRVMWDGAKVTFGGKTDNAQIPAPLVMHLTETFTPDKFTPDMPICLYGEGYGGKIQKAGSTYGPEQRFVLFDAKAGDWWLTADSLMEFSERTGIPMVPTLGVGPLHDMVDLAMSGFHSRWGPFPAEGIVARPIVELTARNGQRIITKIKFKDFRG